MKLSRREILAVVFLSIFVPASIFIALRLTGFFGGQSSSPETVTLPEAIALESERLSFERPKEWFGSIARNISTTYHVEDLSLDEKLLGNYYMANTVSFSLEITATVPIGYVQDVYVVLRENYTFSEVSFFELGYDPNQQIQIFRNMTVVAYSYSENREVIGSDMLRDDEKAFLRLKGLNDPPQIYVRSPVQWVLRSPNNQTHQLDATVELTFFNGTDLKKVVQPFRLEIIVENNRSFETAKLVAPGEYGEDPMLWLEKFEHSDFYKIQLNKFDNITVSMTPLQEQNFDIYLYNSTHFFKASSEESGVTAESISFTADSGGYWFIEVRWNGGQGFYNMTINVDRYP